MDYVGAKEIMGGSRIEIQLHWNETIHGGEITNIIHVHPLLEFYNVNRNWTEQIEVKNRKGAIAVVDKNGTGEVVLIVKEEEIEKPPDAQVWINLVSTNPDLQVLVDGEKVPTPKNVSMSKPVQLIPGIYGFKPVGSSKTKEDKKKRNFQNGGTYTVVFHESPNFGYEVYVNTKANKYAIFWQIPQYIIITMGEIMVSVTGLAFAYSQAPESMKAVLQSGWLLTTFVGNAIVVIVTEAQHGSESQLKHSQELFLFAGLCLICAILFAYLATGYTYVDVAEPSNDSGHSSDGKVSPITDGDIELDHLHNGNAKTGQKNIGFADDDP